MRFVRKNSMLLVYVKASDLKFPIVVPLPLALVEELLRAMTAVAWLCTGGLRGARGRRVRLSQALVLKSRRRHLTTPRRVLESLPKPLLIMFPDGLNLEPWRMVAAARQMVREIRFVGPLNLVDVQTPDAKVYIRLV